MQRPAVLTSETIDIYRLPEKVAFAERLWRNASRTNAVTNSGGAGVGI